MKKRAENDPRSRVPIVSRRFMDMFEQDPDYEWAIRSEHLADYLYKKIQWGRWPEYTKWALRICLLIKARDFLYRNGYRAFGNNSGIYVNFSMTTGECAARIANSHKMKTDQYVACQKRMEKVVKEKNDICEGQYGLADIIDGCVVEDERAVGNIQEDTDYSPNVFVIARSDEEILEGMVEISDMINDKIVSAGR